MKTSLTFTVLICVIVSSTALGADTEFLTLLGPEIKIPEPGVAITVYNDNFAVVKERRYMD